MTSKQKRIGKVIVHREKELDKKVVELGHARVEAERREDALSRERQRLERAAAERDALKARPMTASEWREANEWVESRAKSTAAATQAVTHATQAVEASQVNVLTARRALKSVELYENQLRVEVAKAEDKADQKLQDDLARSRTSAKRSKS
jgi:flagellar export protein FliJ